MAEDKNYYRRMLDQDFQEAPLTDSQQGEVDGTRTYNEMVPAVNQVEKDSRPLRLKYTPEAEERMKNDAESVQKFQRDQEFDQDRFNVIDPSREPQSVVDDILLGKDVKTLAPQAPLMTPVNPVGAAPVNRLSDIATQTVPKIAILKPGSTAPQIIPEQEAANRVRSTGEKLQGELSPEASSAYYDAVKTGEEAKYGGEEAGAIVNAARLEQQQKQIKDALEENSRIESIARTKAEDQLKAMGPMNPDRVWADRSLWSKLALVAGAALLGRAGSSAGLTAMQDLVTKDLESQRADLEAGVKREGSLLELLKPYANNRTELYKMANQVGTEIAKHYAEATKAGIGKGQASVVALKAASDRYKDLVTQQNKNDSNILSVSEAEQKRRMGDEKLLNDHFQNQLAQARMKLDVINMPPGDADRLTSTTAMAIAAKEMKELEQRSDFDPTTIKNAIALKMKGMGLPSSLTEDQAKYLVNYTNYYTYLAHAMYGTRVSDNETERVKNLVAPDMTFKKDSIKLYQRKRAEQINGALNALGPGALLRTHNIPEFREFDVNRAKPLKGK